MYRDLKEHIIKLFGSDTRLDGRKLTEYRQPLKVEINVTPTAEGSARVTLGKTELIVGVKVEVMEPYPDVPDAGSIMVGAELLPLSNPEFEPGPPSIKAIELARVVDRGIRESKVIDFKKLCIKKGEKVWMLIIDICTINDGGNLIDASALGAVAALKSMKFPKYENGVLDYKEKTNKGLDMKDFPITVTINKIADKFIVDADSEEEKAVEARLTVASLNDGTLCALQKGGEYSLTIEDVDKMVELAMEKAKELRKLIK